MESVIGDRREAASTSFVVAGFADEIDGDVQFLDGR
jgi:hypothetical protein